MIVESQLIKIINDAILLGANDVHFVLEDTGLILVHYRSGNLMLPTYRITPEDYKQILNYIDFNTIFKSLNKVQLQSGILIIKDCQKVLECSVSILSNDKFKSLVLHIKNPKPNSKNFHKNFKYLCSKFKTSFKL